MLPSIFGNNLFPCSGANCFTDGYRHGARRQGFACAAGCVCLPPGGVFAGGAVPQRAGSFVASWQRVGVAAGQLFFCRAAAQIKLPKAAGIPASRSRRCSRLQWLHALCRARARALRQRQPLPAEGCSMPGKFAFSPPAWGRRYWPCRQAQPARYSCCAMQCPKRNAAGAASPSCTVTASFLSHVHVLVAAAAASLPPFCQLHVMDAVCKVQQRHVIPASCATYMP